MGSAAALPPWVNLIWMGISACTLLGGAIWIIFIFWPYLKESRRLMRDSFVLAQQTQGTIRKIEADLTPLLDKAHRTLQTVQEVVEKFKARDFDHVEHSIEEISKALNGKGNILDEARETFKKLETHMAVIRDRIVRDTEPLGVKRSGRTFPPGQQSVPQGAAAGGEAISVPPGGPDQAVP